MFCDWMATIWEKSSHILSCSVWKTSSILRNFSPLMSAMRNCYKCCFKDELFALNFFFFSPSPASISAAQSDFYLYKIQYSDSNQKKLLSLSHFSPQSPPPPLLRLSQRGTLSPPLKITLSIFSANTVLSSFLNNSSNFNNFGLTLTLLSLSSNVILQLTNQHCWSTLFRDYCDHLPPTSSCIPFPSKL